MVKQGNVLVEKSYLFSIRIVKLYQHLSTAKKEYILAKQILRSGTSIGANIFESQYAQSKKDFVSKLYISFKESNETEYWLMLLRDTRYIKPEEFENMLLDLVELKKLLVSIIKTSKANS